MEANRNQPSDLRRAVAGCEAILHLATHIPPTSEMRRPNAWAQNDFLRREVIRTLVEAAAEDVSVFVYPSVCRVYPDSGDRWIDAESSTRQGAVLVQSTLEAEEARYGTRPNWPAERGPLEWASSMAGIGADHGRDSHGAVAIGGAIWASGGLSMRDLD